MPTTLLSPGLITQLVQNQIYALPVSRIWIFCETAAATLEQSNTLVFTLAVAVTLDVNKEALLAGRFLRCTSGNVNIMLKKA